MVNPDNFYPGLYHLDIKLQNYRKQNYNLIFLMTFDVQDQRWVKMYKHFEQ